jgi:hypothetical protein
MKAVMNKQGDMSPRDKKNLSRGKNTKYVIWLFRNTSLYAFISQKSSQDVCTFDYMCSFSETTHRVSMESGIR